MRVRFLHRVPGEPKLGGIDELKAQIAADIRTAENFFGCKSIKNISNILLSDVWTLHTFNGNIFY
ncbi:MAG TPA: hypothetical protein DEA22_03680 [Blastocatellia bacterium]|nr:hypothetical protein [Blastocatellia bacterium]